MEHKDLVYNLAFHYLQNQNDAEDICQEVFVKVFLSLEKFRKESKPSTWIYRITVNSCLDLIRSRKRQKRFAFITSLFDDSTGAILHDPAHFMHPGLILEKKEESRQLFLAINELPDQQKTAFILARLDNLPQGEIAAIMGISVKALESLLQRAKINLRKKLQKTEGHSR